MPQVKNSSGEDTRENVTVSSTEDVDLAGSRGTAHFAMKWARDARNQANLNVIEDIKGTALQYTGTGRLLLSRRSHGTTAVRFLLVLCFLARMCLMMRCVEVERHKYKYYPSVLDDLGIALQPGENVLNLAFGGKVRRVTANVIYH